ncbi:MAG: hypothetical protein LBI10_05455 [Deltaproteobacteria bacterium]|jgi:predicted RND superfamily exporter protein|nr:hypothetical protein [Deltaproteobacteria bacterium]
MFDYDKVDQKFRAITEGLLKRRIVIVAACLLLTLAAASGLPHLKRETSQENWFMEGDATIKAKERFEEIFGKDDFCAVLVTADNITAKDKLLLIREMSRELKEETP